LQTDTSKYNLVANIRLVASYQKKSAAASTNAQPATTKAK
jgi:hypothetical protein